MERDVAGRGVDFPAELGGLIALCEVVVHGWDVAAAAGLPYVVDDRLSEALLPYVTASAETPVDGLFAAPVAVPAEAPLLHQVVALTGRNPGGPGTELSAVGRRRRGHGHGQ